MASAVCAALTAGGLATERVRLVVGVTAPGWYQRVSEAVAERLNLAAAVWWGDEHAPARGALVRLSSERDRLRSYLGRRLLYPTAVAGIGPAPAVALVGYSRPPCGFLARRRGIPRQREAMKRPIHYTDHAGLAVVTAFVAIGATAVARWAPTEPQPGGVGLARRSTRRTGRSTIDGPSMSVNRRTGLGGCRSRLG